MHQRTYDTILQRRCCVFLLPNFLSLVYFASEKMVEGHFVQMSRFHKPKLGVQELVFGQSELGLRIHYRIFGSFNG